MNQFRAGTINSFQYLIWLKSKTVKIYSVVQSVKLLFGLSIYLSGDSRDSRRYSKMYNLTYGQENLSSEFPTELDLKQSPLLQRLARKLEFRLLQV